MKKFKIIFPEKENGEKDSNEQESIIKAKLKKISQGILSKIIILLYQYQPCSITELKSLLVNYYSIPLDRANIYKYVKELVDMGLLGFHNSNYALTTTKNNSLIKLIKEKHKEFLEKIPPGFRTRFNVVQYYYTTEYAEKFLPWCAEVINFKINPLEDDKEVENG